MEEHAAPYLQRKKQAVQLRISEILDTQNAIELVRTAFEFHFSDGKSKAFQDYYVTTVENRQYFLASSTFFAEFKKMYSLQGIDGAYLRMLEGHKEQILMQLDRNDLVGIYFNFFDRASLQHGNRLVTKSLASFFAKFIHTFKPDKYCALDNPVKKLLGLSRESFYLSFLAISAAYKAWIAENSILVDGIRAELTSNQLGRSYAVAMSDFKLLDLIFWFKANRPPQ